MENTKETQLSLFGVGSNNTNDSALTDRSGSFADNMKLPFHRWFRYSAGFSANWVRYLFREKGLSGSSDAKVLDPFAGVGTTLIASAAEKIEAVGFEAHPFVFRIAEAKLQSMLIDPDKLYHEGKKLLAQAKKHSYQKNGSLPSLIEKCYEEDAYSELLKLKSVLLNQEFQSSPYFNQLWLLINSILRVTSHVGTAQWQYVLPNRRKAKRVSPFVAFEQQLLNFKKDIQYAVNHNWIRNVPQIINTDARNPRYETSEFIDFVVTSPPYPNNYDYADATRLEMTFWGEVSGWKDLHPQIRQYLITSCSQHSAAEKFDLDALLSQDTIAPIRDELSVACNHLAEVRMTKGGKKTYHTMAAAYFSDLGEVFFQLRKLCKDGAEVCFVIGDSAPYGIYLAVDKWLGELAIAAGFKSYSFEKIRDRNIKWKNRKHRVPLKEGRLWIKG